MQETDVGHEEAGALAQPLSRRAARRLLRALHRVLPRRAYEAVYRPSFSAYHRVVVWRYRRSLAASRRRGNALEQRRRERVAEVLPYSLVGARGLESTHDLAQGLVDRRIGGAFVECGVARGGCAALLARVAQDEGAARPCWFFDSFEGLPDPTAEDYRPGRSTGEHVRPLPRGSCLGTHEEVSRLLFERLELSPEPIALVKGWFQDTLPAHRARLDPIALLRIDGDWYESTRSCLETLFDLVVAGGVVIIDDYHTCFGARRATDTFLRERGLDSVLHSDGRGGCFFHKQ